MTLWRKEVGRREGKGDDCTGHPTTSTPSFQVQDAVLSKWVNDPQRMDKRLLSLIFLAHASDVLENAFAQLNDDDYEVAMKRVRELLDLDYELEAGKPNANEVMWATFAVFTK